ncbi:MAG: bifunctional diaminohydroxyphosphoribosylaminopyrimidine deaminase/5-amino-6-(5-phosphoribosylamino)uracil reductase RibD [Methylobacterium sp.]|jgi:diaminohydroxyphosphoribosylaminopyrimidine deaminase/5-amino-6-(5-phosphoribosylamino)uracil reductase|nr:bifunctional diaminohydroxyphosphoribosylaminopyrimidine deaminase/5-amino-6-(5-phosphoribosylamino)uracil reductase RibD [Methylobacterium sp.]
MMQRPRDEAFMRAAIALARRGLGRTWPNPAVAALVVDESVEPPVVRGRGRTSPGGRPHAEANAVAEAGEAARGATMYVTLEPCARRSQRVFGPSCTEIILESGIARVVIGAADPSPFASGEGTEALRKAGIAVVTGLCEAEAREVTRGHCFRVSDHRPFVTLKLAQTKDGFAGTADRRPLAITGEEARAYVHRLRSIHDALITGIGTVLTDDPRLDVRLPGMAGMSPMRVVLDSEGRMPAGAKIVSEAANAPVLIVSTRDRAHFAALAAAHPPEMLEVVAVPRSADGCLDLAAALGALAAQGITRVMVEAGPTLSNAFAKAGFIDRLELLTGANAIGQGLPAIGPDLAGWIARAHLVGERMLGPDRLEIRKGQG